MGYNQSFLLVLCSFCLIKACFGGETEFGSFGPEMGHGMPGEMGSLMGGGEGGGAGAEGGPLAEIMGLLGPKDQCRRINDCPCGSYCINGENTTCTMDTSEDNDCTCQPGCVLFDKYLYPKSPEEVYGRMCECGDYVRFVRGRVIWCQKGDWVDQPLGVKTTPWNQNCLVNMF